MDFDKYLINLKNLYSNKDNCVNILIDKLIYQLNSERGYLTDTCYSYFEIKHFDKIDFSNIFQFVNTFNKLNNKNHNRDIRTVLKYNDKFILFEELYVPTMDSNIYLYNLEFDLSNLEYDFIVNIEDIVNFYQINIPEKISREYYFNNLCY